MAETVTIEALGHRGDGIVATADGPLYVPFTLPGERVTIERQDDRARVVEILTPSPARSAPLCRHFGSCGGCALQMLPLAETRGLKRDFVAAALAQRGLDAPVAETLGVPPASRRRTTFAAKRAGAKLILGYHARLSQAIVDVAECPVLVPALQARIEDIRSLVAPFTRGGKPLRVTVLMTDSGLDLDLHDPPAPDARTLQRLTEIPAARALARLSLDGEPILTLAEPTLRVSGVPVTPPPGAFLQASAEAEAVMAALVADHLAGARRVADLFSGIGTFALALARQSPVHAVEASEPALAALPAAARRATGLKPITTERRDLFAMPLAPQELRAFDAIVFDPPRAGAKAQAEALAASDVARIAAISCNPATFARDARILNDGGYTLERVVPVDQFVYSAEVEVVGLFRRDRKAGRTPSATRR
jgi:23S rRNA (uracil1939-C5)-methyltransferase